MSAAHPYKHFSSRAVVTLMLGLILTVILFVAIRHHEYGEIKGDFERYGHNRVHALERGVQATESALADISRMISFAGNINRERFQIFAHPFLEQQPQIQNFAYYRLISDVERPAFEAEMSKFYSDFSITEVVEGKRVPAAPRDYYRVIEYVQPIEGNESLLGLNVATHAAESEAILRACKTGLPSAAKPSLTVHRDTTLSGLVMLAPVYRQDTALDSAMAGCEVVIGHVAVMFDIERLYKKIFAKRVSRAEEGYQLSVYAGSSRNAEDLVFRTQDPMPYLAFLPATLGALLYGYPNDLVTSFEAAGRQWQVVASAVPFPVLKNHIASLTILIGGILISLLAAAYMRSWGLRLQRARELEEGRAEKMIWEQVLKETARRLGEEQTRLQELFDQAPGFIAILTGPEHTFDIVNTSFYRLIGHKDILGKPIREALPEVKEQGFYELLDQVYATGEPYVGKNVPITVYSQSGKSLETRYVDFVYQPMSDAAGKVTGIFVQGSDISRQTKAQLELEYLSNHDHVTELPNYFLMQSLLKEMMDKAEKKGKFIMVAVIDIDRFNYVSESFGQSYADRFLKIIAERLKSIAQEGGAVARLNGEKFILALPTLDANDGYRSVTQSITDVIGKAVNIDGHILFITCRIGVATYPADAVDPEALIHCADLAVYGAKDMGPNNVQLYTPELHESVQKRLNIETAMHTALERSEFVLHYQPQVDLRTGSMVGVETLLRWQHPELGILSPESFISIAEDTGLIVPIGEWVLRTACAQMKEWHDAGFKDLRVTVNISARQFVEDDLSVLVHESLKESGLPADRLGLELTETIVMADIERAAVILASLRELGVRLSIDDFGTGYSSLAYLKRLPIDVLKIDYSFIRELPENSNDAAIVDAIISMAHSLGMRVIAEGVETEGQCDFLSQTLCDGMQGYFYSRALPVSDMEALLNEARRLPEHLLRLRKPERNLLLVDDEPSILSALKRHLRKDGYQILTAADGHKGLELLAQNKVDVIVSDQRMPGMTGVEFLRKVKELAPDTVRIVLSGFTELQSVTDAVNEGAIYKFLTKPWDDDQLREHVAEAFQKKGMSDENRRLNIEVRTANQELARANRQLEHLLRHKQQQIQRREVSLDIVREALQYVPLPVIGLDEDLTVAFANIAAYDLFEKNGPILGNPVDQFIPEFTHCIPENKADHECLVEVNGVSFEVLVRKMGQGTQSRGRLLTFARQEVAMAELDA